MYRDMDLAVHDHMHSNVFHSKDRDTQVACIAALGNGLWSETEVEARLDSLAARANDNGPCVTHLKMPPVPKQSIWNHYDKDLEAEVRETFDTADDVTPPECAVFVHYARELFKARSSNVGGGKRVESIRAMGLHAGVAKAAVHEVKRAIHNKRNMHKEKRWCATLVQLTDIKYLNWKFSYERKAVKLHMRALKKGLLTEAFECTTPGAALECQLKILQAATNHVALRTCGQMHMTAIWHGYLNVHQLQLYTLPSKKNSFACSLACWLFLIKGERWTAGRPPNNTSAAVVNDSETLRARVEETWRTMVTSGLAIRSSRKFNYAFNSATAAMMDVEVLVYDFQNNPLHPLRFGYGQYKAEMAYTETSDGEGHFQPLLTESAIRGIEQACLF
jgi:hypothetical protein